MAVGKEVGAKSYSLPYIFRAENLKHSKKIFSSDLPTKFLLPSFNFHEKLELITR